VDQGTAEVHVSSPVNLEEPSDATRASRFWRRGKVPGCYRRAAYGSTHHRNLDMLSRIVLDHSAHMRGRGNGKS
jgi:hypothetical protein